MLSLFIKPILCIGLLIAGISAIRAQDAGDLNSPLNVQRYAAQVQINMNTIDEKLTRQTENYLRKFKKRETRINARLSKADSSAAVALFEDSQKKYNDWLEKTNHASQQVGQLTSGRYIPMIDSLTSSLGFLKDAKKIFIKSKDAQRQLSSSMKCVGELKSNLNQADLLENYIRERQNQLSNLLNNPHLPRSIRKSIVGYAKDVYYYQQQVNEIRATLNDPDKLVSSALALLNKIPSFSDFMHRHSILASLFPDPGNSSFAVGSSNGLPTLIDMQQLIQRQMGSSSGNNTQFVQQQLRDAKSELSKWKNRLNKALNKGGSDLPDFKPNVQKTKSFWKRLEWGTALQTQKSNFYFPLRTDVSLSAGYKISDSKTAGVALVGKIGWGAGWKQIKFTGEGIGIRAFSEWKAKESLWLIASGELSYLKPIDSLAHFKNYSNWVRSALIGISRPYQVNKKIKGKIQVLLDLLYRENVPQTEPLVFRLGYTF